MSTRLYLSYLALTLTMAGCAPTPTTGPLKSTNVERERTRISAREATDIAKRAAEQRGVDLDRYQEPEARFQSARKGGTWYVLFKGRTAVFGNHFSVSVDDETGGTRFVGGR